MGHDSLAFLVLVDEALWSERGGISASAGIGERAGTYVVHGTAERVKRFCRFDSFQQSGERRTHERRKGLRDQDVLLRDRSSCVEGYLMSLWSYLEGK